MIKLKKLNIILPYLAIVFGNYTGNRYMLKSALYVNACFMSRYYLETSQYLRIIIGLRVMLYPHTNYHRCRDGITHQGTTIHSFPLVTFVLLRFLPAANVYFHPQTGNLELLVRREKLEKERTFST